MKSEKNRPENVDEYIAGFSAGIQKIWNNYGPPLKKQHRRQLKRSATECLYTGSMADCFILQHIQTISVFIP